MIDVLKFQHVIKDVITKTKVPPNKVEDLTQECYLSLIEQQDLIEKARSPEDYAASVCRSKIYQVWKQENDISRVDGKNYKPDIWFLSLSDPKIYQKVAKIACQRTDITDEELYSGILQLPLDEAQVIYGIFVEGLKKKDLAEQLGIGIRRLNTRLRRGIKNLKEYFEVVDGD